MSVQEESVDEYTSRVVGIGYITVSTVVIPLHIVCSLLMWKDKEMRNPTYQFIINLSIADVLELVPLGWYAGIVILLNIKQNYYLERFMGFWCLSAWYANCVLFVFIAFSRWIAMTRAHLVNFVFTKRKLFIFHTVPWIMIVLFYFYSLFLYPTQTFYFYPDLFSWEFNVTIPFGKYLHWHNFTFNTICAVVEMFFNILSLKWVHDTRKQIRSFTATENRRRETKLLIQCFVLGCFFTLASVMFTIVIAGNLKTPMAFLAMQICWTFNHCVNPIVYLTINTKLRRAFLRFISMGKFGQPIAVKPINVTVPPPIIIPVEPGMRI